MDWNSFLSREAVIEQLCWSLCHSPILLCSIFLIHSLQCEMTVFIHLSISYLPTQNVWHSQVVLVVKNPPANAGHISGKNTGVGCHLPPGRVLWRRTWQPTPVFLPGQFHGQRSLVGYRPWGCKESDVTEHTHTLAYPQDLKQFWHETGIYYMLNKWINEPKILTFTVPWFLLSPD